MKSPTYDFGRIREAIWRLQDAFQYNFITPVAIDLSCREDGIALMHMIDREHSLYVELGMDPRTGEARQQVTVDGVIIRWPVYKRALPGGGFEWV